MTDTIAVSGVVATPPSIISKTDDLTVVSFRLASTQRRFDKGRDRWVDTGTNWYSITAFRQLAVNVDRSVLKGDKVVVTGKLRVRDWENGEKKGTNVDIEASSIGHDLAWGTTTFVKSTSTAPVAEEAAPESEEELRGDLDADAPATSVFDGVPATAPF